MTTLNRRNFMKTSAASAAAAFAIASHGRASANDRIGVAILGCRNRGHQVADSMLGHGGFDIVSLCDPDTAMIRRAYGALRGKLEDDPKPVQDFRRTLEDPAVDVIVNATPDHWHAATTLLALDAGKHVYLEKPATYNIDEGKWLVAAQRKYPDRVIAMGTQQRSGQHFKDAREFIQSGGLGKIGFCRAWITHDRGVIPVIPDTDPPDTMDFDLWVGPAPYRPYNENTVHYNWHFMLPWGTGEMGNWGAHWLDIARWNLGLGLPAAVSGSAGMHVVHDAKEWPDTLTAIFEYPGLTLLWEQRIWTSQRLHGESSGVEFAGEKGALLLSRRGWTFFPKEGRQERHRNSNLMEPHIQNFADALRGNAPAAVDVEEGHKTATLCHLGNIAGLLNRRIAFDPEQQEIVDDDEAANLLRREYRPPWQAEIDAILG